ncbi:MAG: tRNA lysidine(34) synthetase TilS [Planctomycetota bacterium]
MEPLEQKVARFVEANGLFKETHRVLLAISGGADSTALLHVMQALVSHGAIVGGLVCGHVNHQLRGAASDEDEAFAVEQAQALGLPVLTRTASVNAFAKAHGLSVETAGRQLRLRFLGETAAAHGCGWIATGHQKNDNAETVIHRLRRGTGFRGLAGIWPARQLADESRLARPLLCCTRAELVTYLRARHLKWREDRTNADCAYTRNFVRHRLLPSLQRQSSDSLIEELTNLAASARRLHQRVVEQAESAASRHVQSTYEGIVINAAGMASLPDLVAVELIRGQLTRLGCGERDLTQYHYRGILRLAQPGTNPKTVTLPAGFTATREYETVFLRRPVSSRPGETLTSSIPLSVPGTARFARYRIEARILDRSEIEVAQIRRDKDPFREYLDLDRVGLPLVVRRRCQGDRFHPLGSAGEKKVGKFLTAAKVPEMVRRDVLIFADAVRIVWVCPVRIGELTKITEHTRRILALSAIYSPLPKTTASARGESARSGDDV